MDTKGHSHIPKALYDGMAGDQTTTPLDQLL